MKLYVSGYREGADRIVLFVHLYIQGRDDQMFEAWEDQDPTWLIDLSSSYRIGTIQTLEGIRISIVLERLTPSILVDVFKRMMEMYEWARKALRLRSRRLIFEVDPHVFELIG